MRHSPPKSPTSPHYTSEPNLTTLSTSTHENFNVTQRKRKRENDELERMENMMKEMKTMITELVSKQTHQSDKMDTLQSALDDIRSQNLAISTQNSEIRLQNEEIQKSMAFLSSKYDDAIVDITNLRAECSKNQKVISALEQKIDFLEKSLKASSIEIKNIPTAEPETTETLTHTVQILGNVISQPLQKNDIKNIFRLKNKTDSTGTVLVEFASPAIKEKFLTSTKNYNKNNKENRLNTTHLHEKYPKHPLYISEVLTAMTRRLHYLAREFVKNSDYDQCWTANGKVYVREKQGMPGRLIKSDDDLKKLQKQK